MILLKREILYILLFKLGNSVSLLCQINVNYDVTKNNIKYKMEKRKRIKKGKNDYLDNVNFLTLSRITKAPFKELLRFNLLISFNLKF